MKEKTHSGRWEPRQDPLFPTHRLEQAALAAVVVIQAGLGDPRPGADLLHAYGVVASGRELPQGHGQDPSSRVVHAPKIYRLV